MIKEHEKKFLEFLSLKSSYDYDPEFVQIIQTHISIVAVAPPFVFKIKKNIKLDFLDYSTLEKRRFYMEREIELNRRLCDNVYLEIVPIYEFEGLLSFKKFFHTSGKIFDYALKMNYMKPELCLVNILKNRAFDDRQMDALILKLGEFYLSQKPDPGISENGRPEAVKEMFDRNLDEFQNVAGKILSPQGLKIFADFSTAFFERHKNIFKNRYESGYIKDCHGDLRLEHIYIHEHGHDQHPKICIYDCVEFNDGFRHIDILNDLAFLLMELDYEGYGNISAQLRQKINIHFSERLRGISADFTKYSDRDFEVDLVLVYYKIYRALVRAKVNCIVSGEDEIGEDKRRAAVENAGRFFSLGVKYALTLDQPCVFVVMGKTATGKSTIAQKISEVSGIQIVSTDITRKQLAKIEVHKETPAELKSEIYSPEFTTTVYDTLLSNAEKILAGEGAVILDGTFGKEKYRRLIRDRFGEKFSNLRVLFIEVVSSDAEKIKRLKSRESTGAISDARAKDKQKIDALYEEPNELSKSMKITINNFGEIDDVAATLYEEIMKNM